MTIGKLSKLLIKMIEQGHARKRVCVQKDTFSHPLEDDVCVILNVEKAEMVCFPMLDDDGGTKILADGRERYNTALVIRGR